MNKKRLTSLFLSLCMLLGMFTAVAAESGAAPELVDGAYLIDSAEDMFWFASEVNGGNRTANAVLEDDIDLGGEQWTPIGAGYDYKNLGIDGSSAYYGTFDGNGHTVSGLFIETKKYKKFGQNHYETYCQGLFGIIGKSGVVKNLTVDGKINARAQGNEYISAANYAGGIAGINAGLILNCTNNAEITAHRYVGGICGQVGAQFSDKEQVNGEVISAVNNADVTATSESFAEVGGICGQISWGKISYSANHGAVKAPNSDGDMYSAMRGTAVGGISGNDINVSGSSAIDRCFNDGKIGLTDGNYVSGIIGLNHSCDVTNVYNAGEVTGYNYTGALAGYKLGGTIKNAYNSAAVNSNSGYALIGSLSGASADNLYNIGDNKKLVAAEKDTDDISNVFAVDTVTAAQLSEAFVDTENLPALDFSDAPAAGSFDTSDEKPSEDESGYWTALKAEKFTGDGSSESPYVIESAEELALLAYRVNHGEDMTGRYFVLGTDIDLTGAKWKPIGKAEAYLENKYTGKAFNGVFDGKNHSITGLDVSENGYLSGLFAIAEDKAVIKNLSVYGSVENTNTDGYGTAAAVCAVNYGLISNCKNHAEVTSVNCGGGIVGRNGAVNKTVTSSVITQCENRGSVNGAKESGGIAAYSSGTVTKCANKSDVTSNDGYAGGVVGYNYEGSILLDSCYNTGAVTGAAYAGGISGKSYNCDITNSYNAGKITAKYPGGILGFTVSGYLVKNCYYLNDTAPMPYGENSGTGFETKTERELSALSAKLGNAFVSSEKFPVLTWEVNGADDITEKPSNGGGTGGDTNVPEDTEKAPQYSSEGNWSDFAEAFGGSGEADNPYTVSSAAQLAYLANEVNSGNSFKDKYFELTADIDLTDKFFTPIGVSESTPFSGIFNGGGHEITINTENTAVSGLFGFTDGARISMLGVSGISNASETAGGLIGTAKNTSAENCYSNVFAYGGSHAGGFIGRAMSGTSVTNCYAGGKAAAEKSGTMFGFFANGVSANNLFYRIAGTDEAIGENGSTNTTVALGKTSEYMQSDLFADDLWLVREKTVDGEKVEVPPVFAVGEKFPVLGTGFTDCKIISVKINAPGKRLESGAKHTFTLTVYGKNLAKSENAVWSSDSADTVIAVKDKTTADITFNGTNTSVTVTAAVGGLSDSVTVSVKDSLWSGKGTETEPYIISSLDDMKTLAESVNSGNSYKGVYFALADDVDLTDDDAFGSIGYWDGLCSDDDGQWFESDKNRAFEGVFDGNGHSVKNAVFYAQNSFYGMFAYIGKDGVVKNLNIDASNRFTAHNNVTNVSALCGVNAGRIENCTVSADYNFTAADVRLLSGISGLNYGTIADCKNTSDMTESGTAKSGITGANYGTVSGCENSGSISNAICGGGIAAENRSGAGAAISFTDKYRDIVLNGEIKNCVNTGSVSANADTGGIVADNYSGGLISECENRADITGYMTGGIAGRASGCYEKGGIKYCKNSGNITANGSYGGGIVGELINGLVYFGENSGNVNGAEFAGGIAGRNYSSTSIGASAVDFSNNSGNVKAKTAAGIAAYYQDESGKCHVRYSYNSGEAQYGIVGKVNSRYDLDGVILENYCLSGKSEKGEDGINGITFITEEQLKEYPTDSASIAVDSDNIKVNESTAVKADTEVYSSDESIVTAENGVVTGKGAGRAYLFTKSNPYTYAAVTMNVEEDEASAARITVSFRLIGEENFGTGFVLDKNTPNTYKTWIPTTKYTVKAGSTVKDVFKTALDDAGLKCRGLESGYISSIQSPEGYWLGEFSNGKYSGWMYTINGSHPALGLDEYKLTGDEEIIWHYVDDYRQEVADWSDGGTVGDNSLHNRWLAAADKTDDNSGSNSGNTTGGSTSGGGSVSPSKTDSKADSEAKPEQSAFNVFNDVKADAWYYDAVRYAYENKLVNGISETEFAPEEKLTRAMLVTMLYRAENEPDAEKAEFADVNEGAWYYNAVAWAKENGIVNGISETEFAPDVNITREQTAAIIYRYASLKGYNMAAGESTDILSYTDYADISEYAVTPLKWTSGMSIMTGKTKETINPSDLSTRAEIAAVLMRLFMIK